MQTSPVELSPYAVLCREGDPESDLYMVVEGELLICVCKGTQVTPVATLGAGEFLGELSFFDQRPRAANVIALTKCLLVRIPSTEVRQSFPSWLATVGKELARKVRHHDELIRVKGIKKTKAESIKALTIDQQREIYSILSK
jgi:CRP/FNR family transcriptional regulator, cyclic AMP receptor protein